MLSKTNLKKRTIKKLVFSKKSFLLFLFACILLSCFASCSNETKNDPNDISSPDSSQVIYDFSNPAAHEQSDDRSDDPSDEQSEERIDSEEVSVESSKESPKVTIYGVSIESAPTKTSYYVGDTFDCSGLKLRVNYSDGSSKIVKDGYTCDLPTFKQKGTQSVTISYGGIKVSINVTVTEKAATVSVGSYITFGRYEQDNNMSNGKEDIEWLVLDVRDGKALVISKHALDCQPYNDERGSVTWESCTLRKWLNDEFLYSAFSSSEINRIPTVTVSADKNPKYDTNPGNATQDKVFLLSITEAEKYFSSDFERRCEATAYTEAQGAYTAEFTSCDWWLRSPGGLQDFVAYVSLSEDFIVGGDVREYGYDVSNGSYAVRPALWINLNS